MRPLVSIVTPSYNQGHFIEETIRSVLFQDYDNIEYIVIDGGSTDDTLDILHRYEGQLTWISEPDKGQSHAINKGFKMARGSIVAWLNSDDTFLPGAIDTAVSHFEANPEVEMLYGEGYLIDEEGNIKQRFPATEPFNLWRLIYYGDYILQQTVFMKLRVLEKVGMLDESLHFGMDWDLWIRVGKNYRIDYINKFLGNLREYDEAKTFSGGLKRLRELALVMRKHGTRRYPPAYFNYAWDPYQEALILFLQRFFPINNWKWLARLGTGLRRLTRYMIFNRITYLSQPSPSPDGWVSNQTPFLFSEWKNKKMIRIVGSTMNVPDSILPIKIKVLLNGRTIQNVKVNKTERFEITNVISASSEKLGALEVVLKTNRFFVPAHLGQNKDKRRLAFQLKTIELI